MKTTQEWFNSLKEDYRDKALKNMLDAKSEHFSLAGAISNGFIWENTPEGKEYWNKVFREIMYGEKFEEKTPQPIVVQNNDVNETINSLESEVVKIPVVKELNEDNSVTKISKVESEEKTENLYTQYKMETETQTENSLPSEEDNDLYKKYKLEQENYK